jgi:hypothetical protein
MTLEECRAALLAMHRAIAEVEVPAEVVRARVEWDGLWRALRKEMRGWLEPLGLPVGDRVTMVIEGGYRYWVTMMEVVVPDGRVVRFQPLGVGYVEVRWDRGRSVLMHLVLPRPRWAWVWPDPGGGKTWLSADLNEGTLYETLVALLRG